MDSIEGDKTLIYANIKQNVNVNQKETAKRDNQRLERKLRLANLSDDEIELVSRQKAYKDYKNDSMRVATGALFTAIPIVHTIASGIMAKGSAAKKTTIAASTAKNWGIALTAGLLFSKAADFILGTEDKSNDFAKKHPVATLGTFAVGTAVVDVEAIRQTDKLFKKLTGKDLDKKIAEKVENFSPVKNKTYGEVLDKAEKFMESSKGHYVKQGALIGTSVIVAKQFLDCTRVDKNIKKSEEDLKRKRLEASREVANTLWTKRHEQNPFKTKVDGVILISSQN